MHCGRSGLSRKLTTQNGRPGFLSGFFEQFSSDSIQLFGRGEQQYLKKLEDENNFATLEKFFSYPIPTCIFTEGGSPNPSFNTIAERSGCSVLQTPLDSADFTKSLIQLLEEIFAPTMTIQVFWLKSMELVS